MGRMGVFLTLRASAAPREPFPQPPKGKISRGAAERDEGPSFSMTFLAEGAEEDAFAEGTSPPCVKKFITT